jgi:hypothetical protein
MTAAFTSAECDVLEQALDAAWEIFLRSRKLDERNLDTARAALTRAILDQYESGERNVRRIAIAAVAGVAPFEAANFGLDPARPADDKRHVVT